MKGDAVHAVLTFVPRRAESELEPAVAQVIDGHRHLREDGGLAIRDAGDEATHTQPRRNGGKRRER